MKALIIDGFKEADGPGAALNGALEGELRKRGWAVESLRPAERQLAYCNGDFFCWLKTPGACSANDVNREFARAAVAADLLIYTCPITFGGYSSTLKKIVDHIVQIIMPFFTRVEGEVHHAKRYRRYPRFLAIGMLDDEDGEAETVFRALVWRNSLNMHTPASACAVVRASGSPDETMRALGEALDNVEGAGDREKHPVPEEMLLPDFTSGGAQIKEALLLVGSPRGLKSSSFALGSYLTERLSNAGVRVRTVTAIAALRSPEGMRELSVALGSADLVVVAFPLYIDSLPAPLTRVLEEAASGASRSRAQGARLAAIVNCGFPEAAHNRIALAICRNFARRAGFIWAGGLSMGAGEGMIHQQPLVESGGQTMPIRRALDMTADALMSGKPVPRDAAAIMAKSIIPERLYLLIGKLGWMLRARKLGGLGRMRARPYEAKA
jgi:multimeric flavodoxin WrbA